MKHHARDLVLVLASYLQAGLLVAWAFHARSLGLGANLSVLLLLLGFAYFNPIVVTHNFLHTPFFRWRWANVLFGAHNSMSMGLPTVLYRYHHLAHHRHNNSLEDPSSTYRYGKAGKQEHWLRYSLLSVFRDGTQKAFLQLVRRGEGALFAFEALHLFVFWYLLVRIDAAFFGTYYLAYWLLGWCLAHVENYFEHFHATAPASRFGNAVSFYHPLYNALMFNEGYHQEHHISPQEHWSHRPRTRQQYEAQMRASGAHQAKFPPLLGMLE